MTKSCTMSCKEAKRLFKFPDRNKQTERWKKWIRLLGAPDNIYGRMYACQKHFSKDKFRSTHLLRDAIPDLFLSDLYISDCNSQTPKATEDSGFIPEVSTSLLTSTCNVESSQNSDNVTESQKSLLPGDSISQVERYPLPDSTVICSKKIRFNFEDTTVIDSDVQEFKNFNEYSPRELKMLQEIKDLKRELSEKEMQLEKCNLEIKRLCLKKETLMADLGSSTNDEEFF